MARPSSRYPTELELEILKILWRDEPAAVREVRDAAEVFGATTLDVGAASITFELCDHPSRVADFLKLIDHYGVVDLVKSGRVALARGAKSNAVANQ